MRPVQNSVAQAGQAGRIVHQPDQVRQNQRGRSARLSQRFEIQGIPTLLFFKNGKVVDRIVGLLSTDDLKARLESFAGTNAPARN